MKKIDLSSKRAKLAIRFFGYGIMTLSTIVLTVILIFVALGYRFDQKDLTFDQGGLVQFRSAPEGANITIDGQRQSIKTPDKINLDAGQHTFTFDLTGYRQWQKTIDLAPGQLLWVNYPRLIPNEIKTEVVRDFDNLVSNTTSPDRHWMLLQTNVNTPNFILADISNEKQPKFSNFDLSETIFTKKDGKLGNISVIEWDLGSKYILLKHEVGDITEFIRADRTKAADAINATNIFGLPTKDAHFSANNANVLFAQTGDILRKLDLGAKSASGALANNVQKILVYGQESVAYIAKDADTNEQIVGVYRQGNTTNIRTVPANQEIVFAYSEYDDHRYLALGTTTSSRIDIIRDPSLQAAKEETDVFARFDLGVPLKDLSFSNNGRMVLAQNGNTISSYDIEEAKSYSKTINISQQTSKLRWLDDYYLLSDSENTLHSFEFDGLNQQQLLTVQSGFTPILSGNGKRLFSIAKNSSNGKFVLQNSKMTLND